MIGVVGMAGKATRSARLRWVAVGFAIGHYFDPQLGGERRAALRHHAGSAVHRVARSVNARNPELGGRLHRQASRIAGTTTDEELAAKVLDALPSWRGLCAIEANNGVVIIRGEVNRVEDILAVEVDVRGVDGVREVLNLLHVEGTPAPEHRLHAAPTGSGAP